MREEDIKKLSPFKSLQKTAGSVMMLTSSVLLLYVLWMLVIPIKVVDLKTLELCDRNGTKISEVHPGQHVFYKLRYRKYIPAVSTVHVQVINKFILSYPTFTINLPTTCREKLVDKKYYETVMAELQFPESSMAGEHHLNLTFEYQVNFFRKEVYTISSDSFGVKIKGVTPQKVIYAHTNMFKVKD